LYGKLDLVSVQLSKKYQLNQQTEYTGYFFSGSSKAFAYTFFSPDYIYFIDEWYTWIGERRKFMRNKLEINLCDKKQIDLLIEDIIIESEALYSSLLRLLPYGKKGNFLSQAKIDSIANKEMEPEYGVADPCMVNSWYTLYKYRKMSIPDFIKIGNCEFVDSIITNDNEISEADLLRFYYARCDSLGWN
jgi:hypothetical protein